VRRHRQQFGTEGLEIKRDVPGGGHAVHVDGDAMAATHLDHVVDVLDGADFVVGRLAVHHRRQAAVLRLAATDRLLDSCPADTPGSIDGDVDDAAESSRRVPYGRVLDSGASHRCTAVVSEDAPDG
jgi:hypothetical protein